MVELADYIASNGVVRPPSVAVASRPDPALVLLHSLVSRMMRVEQMLLHLAAEVGRLQPPSRVTRRDRQTLAALLPALHERLGVFTTAEALARPSVRRLCPNASSGS